MARIGRPAPSIRSRQAAEETSATARPQVQNMVTDPIWSLRPWPLDIELGHLYLTIPALPAANWLAVLLVENLDGWPILPGLCDDAQIYDLDEQAWSGSVDAENAVLEALLDGSITFEDVRDVTMETISTVTGRPWWIALRLISVARQSWTVVGGELAFRRIDAGLVSLAAWLDAVHLIILKGMDAKDVVMFASRLEAPPPGVEVAEPVMDAGAFMAMG